MSTSAELYIGLMSGTSLDALDASLVEFSTGKRDCLAYKILARHSLAIPQDLRAALGSFNLRNTCTLAELARLDRELAELAAQVVAELLAKSGYSPTAISASSFLGQTIVHNRDAQQAAAWTHQCLNPSILAEISGISVVADFRRRDMAAGGQGAPLASGLHAALFGTQKCWILNLGGIANLTLLQPGQPPLGFDVGPANCLLDEWAQTNGRGDYDRQGAWAASGSVIEELLSAMMEDEYFSKPYPKSTGRDYFNLTWAAAYLERLGQRVYAAQDIQATLTELTALAVAVAISAQPELDEDAEEAEALANLYVAGGGAKNEYLMERLRQLVRLPVKTTEELGVLPEDLETLAVAWLAYRRLHNKPNNLPSVTGARGARVLGAVYL